MRKVIVVYNPKEWNIDVKGVEIISSKDYLTKPEYSKTRNIRVFNLSKEYVYQSRGYYVSLLAEARGHKPLPDIKSILDLRASSLYRSFSSDIDELIQKSLKKIKSKEFTLSIYFGKNLAKQYNELSSELYKIFRAPLLRARFVFNKKWSLHSIKPISYIEIPKEHLPYVKKFAQEYFNKKHQKRIEEKQLQYDMAILVDPNEKDDAPSSPKSLQKFIEYGEKNGFNVELITADDFHRLEAYDALFIRMTTHVNNVSYKFARRAQSDGIALIDYPETILKCSNKVFMSELLDNNRIPAPKTMVVHSSNKDKVLEKMGLPVVLKAPDSAFSLGVKKAKTKEEYYKEVDNFLKTSDLIVAQEFTPTDYDWRIGVIDGRAFFACKYFMAPDHWQIYNWSAGNYDESYGQFETMAVGDVPKDIIETAVKAANLMHPKGLFGVDMKVYKGVPIVIEINDNPNLDFEVEDRALGDEFYRIIFKAFRDRLEGKN